MGPIMVTYVMGSRHRQRVLKALEGEPKTASDLSDELDVRIQTASRALRELAEKSLARCVNPEKKKGRVYELTEKGEKTVQRLPYGEERLERKVAERLNGLNAEYTRNKRLRGGTLPAELDFLVEAGGGRKIAVEVKIASPERNPEALRSAAFTARDLKERMDNLTTVLIAGGSQRKDPTDKTIGKLEGQKYFDKIFFEDELEEFARYVEDELKRE